MKSLIIAAFAVWLCLFNTDTNHSASLTETNDSTLTAMGSGGFIIMEDVILMRTNTEDPTETISRIVVSSSFGQTVLDISGCGQSSCITDLSALSNGTYTVTVTTDANRSFSEAVHLNQ